MGYCKPPKKEPKKKKKEEKEKEEKKSLPGSLLSYWAYTMWNSTQGRGVVQGIGVIVHEGAWLRLASPKRGEGREKKKKKKQKKKA